jgi:hypothetical protein
VLGLTADLRDRQIRGALERVSGSYRMCRRAQPIGPNVWRRFGRSRAWRARRSLLRFPFRSRHIRPLSSRAVPSRVPRKIGCLIF